MKWRRFQIQFAKFLDQLLGRILWLVPKRIFAGPPRSRPESPRKILFIKFWGMGSIILSQPALAWLAERHPGAQLHLLTFRANRGLEVLLPCVSKAYTISSNGLTSFFFSSLRALFLLRREKYDLVFDGEFLSNYSALIACLTGGRFVTGFAGEREIRRCFHDQSLPFLPAAHTVEQFLRLVQIDRSTPAGLMAVPRLILPDRGYALKAESPYLVLNINAGALSLERRWSMEKFSRLARALLDRYGVSIVLIASKAEIRYVARFASNLPSTDRVKNLAGQLDIAELAGVIGGALLMISNDSGPLHMAAALNVPVVGFFGPETPLRYGPVSARKLIFYRGLHCSPCMSLENSKTVKCRNQLSCLEGISAEQVINDTCRFIDREVLGGAPSDQHGRVALCN